MTARAGRPGACVAAALAVAALVAGTSSPAGASPTQDGPAGGGPASITVLSQDLEVDADGDFSVFLQVDGAPAGSDLAVDIYERITNPADLAASTTTNPAGEAAVFPPIELAADGDTTTQTSGFAISLFGPDDDRPEGAFSYELGEAGVYPIRIRLRGSDDELLTSIVTYLVRRPSGDDIVAPAQVALLTTVHENAPIAVPGSSDGTEEAATIDPEWRADLDLVLGAFADRPALPASFVVTPESAARLAADADSDAEAADTLAALQAEVGRDGRELTGAPYVDIDSTSLVANGLKDEVIRQTDLGTRTLTSALALPEGSDWPGKDTWVVDQPIDDATVNLLADRGVSHLVLTSDAIVADTAPTRLPLPGGRTEALIAGPPGFGSRSSGDGLLAGYQLLGRLAATASITPGGTATALRIDPEEIDPVQLTTVLDVLAQPGAYLRATTLDGAFSNGPVAAAPVTLSVADTGELGTYPALVNETHQLLSSYASMIIDRPDLVQAFERPLALSAAAETDLGVRRRMLRRVQAELDRRLGAISAPARERVTLGARDAQFPLALTSTLAEPVKVVITLEASDRLAFPNEGPIEVTLSGERTVVQIPVRTRATGDTPLRITVRTPDQRHILAESQYTVRSTAVSGVGLLLTIGAASFLAIWWGRHWLNTRRQSRQTHPSRGGAGSSSRDLIEADDAPSDDRVVVDRTDVTPSAGTGSNPH